MKIITTSILSIYMMIFLSCGTKPNDGEETGAGGGTPYPHYITKTGGSMEKSNWTSSFIQTNYDIFFFLPEETRKIYFGGKLWASSSSSWGYKIKPVRDNYSYYEKLGFVDADYCYESNSHWYEPFSFNNTEVFPGDIHFDLQAGDLNGTNFTNIGVSHRIILKVGNEGDRDWNLHVYEQIKCNEFDDNMKNAINQAFYGLNNGSYGYESTMNVKISYDLKNRYCEDKILDDNTIGNPDPTNSINYFSYKPAVRWAYKYIKNLTTVPDGYQTFLYMCEDMTMQPNHGYLFYIQDFSSNSNPSTAKHGECFELTSTDGGVETDRWGIAWVFAKRIRDDIRELDWEDLSVRATTNHELGHLWCKGFIAFGESAGDDPDHLSWHNGDNKDNCLMRTGGEITDGNLSTEEQNRCKLGLFCEGHNQRGMNVSWQRDQYSPLGQRLLTQLNDSNSEQYIFASIDQFSQMKNTTDKFEVNLESDSTEFFEGQSINYKLIIKNNSEDTIFINIGSIIPEYYDIDRNNSFPVIHLGGIYLAYQVNPQSKIVLPRHKLFAYLDNTIDERLREKAGNYWQPGYYKLLEKVCSQKSNELIFKIKPAPEDAKHILKTLIKFESYFSRKENFYQPEKEFFIMDSLYRNNVFQNTIYEKEFYTSFICRLSEFTENEKAFQQKLYLELFKKYPIYAWNSWDFYRNLIEGKEYNPELYYQINKIVNELPPEKKNHLMESLHIYKKQRSPRM